MKTLCLLAAFLAVAGASAAGPLATVIRLLGEMDSKIKEEGAQAAKDNEEYKEWCRSTNQETAHKIDRNNDNVDKFAALQSDSAGKIEALTAEISNLAAKTSQDTKDLEEATKLRKQQNSDYVTAEKDLTDTVDTLVRAAGILRKAGLGGRADVKAALVQVAKTLSVVMDAAVVEAADKKRLHALLQAAEDKDDDDDDDKSGYVQPTAAVYKSHSGDIIEMLAELKVKAEGELADLRKEEMNRQHEFDLLSQGLNDSINTQERDRKNNVASLEENKEIKGKAEGDLASEKNDLAANEKFLADTEAGCKQRTEDYAAEVKSRNEELAAIAEATRIIEGTAAKANESFKAGGSKALSLMQVEVGTQDPARAKAVEIIRGVARRFRSVELAQLALRAQDDTFGKVKGLIRDMVKRLQKKAAEEADHQAYCVAERKENSAKRDDITNKLNGFAARLQQAKADEGDLKEAIAQLSSDIVDLDAAMQEATKQRQKESADYANNAEGFRVADEGLNQALSVLREYYASQDKAHAAKADSSSGIIAMIETVVQDSANAAAQAEMVENKAQKDFDKFIQEGKVNKATMEASRKAKEGEVKRLASAIADLQSDVDGAQKELDAVLTYLEKLKGMCEHKPQTFAERAAARQEEIQGLKQALEILENETAASFLQK
jgi:hypothetical protein